MPDNVTDEDIIDKKLSLLPKTIGKYSRRFALIDNPSRRAEGKSLYIIQYTTKGLILGKIADNSADEILYYIEATSIDELVDKTKTIIDLDKRLESVFHDAEEFVYIEQSAFDRGVTNINLIKAYGQGTLKAKNTFRSECFTHIMFLVQSEDYTLAFGRKGNNYFIKKNDYRLDISIPENLNDKPITVNLTWGLDFLALAVNGNLEKLVTPLLPPPNSLYGWARQNLLKNPPSYTRAPKVYNKVNEVLDNLNEDISLHSDIAPFWDKQKEKGLGAEPKYEPEITQHIESRLRDMAYINNLSITRERQVGNGQIDLVFSGNLNTGKLVEICVEVKKADASDLIHGMTVQLPEYMRRLSTNFGIYCVLYFGSEYHPKEPMFKKSKLDIVKYDPHTLHQLLGPLLPESNSLRIRPIIIDISKKKSPSKM